MRLDDARARAIAQMGRSRGARAFLGVPLDGDDAGAARRIAARIGDLARSACFVGKVTGGATTFPVFAPADSGVRLLTRPLRDGSFVIVAATRTPPSARPPSYVPRLDQLEIEYDFNLKPMDARLVWSDKTLTLDQIKNDPKYRGKLSNLVYIPVDGQGQPLKVGQSDNLADPEPKQIDGKRQGPKPRYPGGLEPAKHGAASFWVARIVPRKGAKDADLSGAARQAERVVARKLHLMGFPLSPWHQTPDQKEPIAVDPRFPNRQVRVRDAVPEPLRQQQLKDLQRTPTPTDAAAARLRAQQIAEARSRGMRVRSGKSRELEG